MRKLKRTIVLVLILIIPYVLYIFISTGFFRTIENTTNFDVYKTINIPGVEDITIDEAKDFGIFISYDRAGEREGQAKKGGIYGMYFSKDAIKVKYLTETHKRELAPHGISLIEIDSTKHRLFVINHAKGESIEVYDLFHKDSLVHVRSLRNELIYSPNDIVAISEDKFYVTNDHYYNNTVGRLAENYLEISNCETVYFDGFKYRVVDNDLSYANGINFDNERNLMFIASPRSFKINVYNRLENGDLNYIESIDCGTGVDNIEFDKDGNLLVGCHPNLLAFSSYSKGNREFSPSEIIKINYRRTGDYTVNSIYVNDGKEMSASTVAPIYRDLMVLGNVMDKHFLVLKQKNRH